MPAEAICDILALTWEAYRDTANGPPWYLGHICRFWVHSVLSYLNLWSSITIPSFKSSEGSHVLASIDAQLERSADVPLDLYWPSVQSVDPHLLDLVFRHCRRWRSLHFHDPAQVRDRMLHWLRPVIGQLDGLPSELPASPSYAYKRLSATLLLPPSSSTMARALLHLLE
ncbi:hypothetical protein B0H14DRAFT_1441840 [Mycena olivaceomarginata]|nr:hypothetical protein B0H14DRAFT_1441840 [Mycena olivaceomarginata]